MKHIFLINSNITMLMALKTIEYEKIKLDDCGFFCTRKYRIPEEFNIPPDRIIDFDFLDNMQIDLLRKCFLQALKYFSNRRILRNIDRAVDRLTDNEPFELYIYHGREYACELIYTHRNCRHYSYIEEGTLSYSYAMKPDYKLSRLKLFCFRHILRIIFNRRVKVFSWETAYDCTKAKFRTIYCSNSAAFPGYSNKIITGMPFAIEPNIPADLQSIIVFDGGSIDIEAQKASLKLNIEHASRQGLKKVYYKFHPVFADDRRSIYRQYFQDLSCQYNITTEELPPQACLENIAYTLRDKLSLYIVCSSAGFYASLCGSNIYCTARYFIDRSPALQRFFQILPESLFTKFTFL